MVAVSIILPVHREGVLLLPTLESLDSAVGDAKSAGVNCELLVVSDRASASTLSSFSRWVPTHLERITQLTNVGVGVSAARNFGLANATGDFVWIADGDDLVSRNSLSEMYRLASSESRSVYYFENLLAFGEKAYFARYTDSTCLTPADFSFSHPYTSRIFIRRLDLATFKYRDVPFESGFAFEDWDLNNRLYRAGFKLKVAPGTTLAYRVRSEGLHLSTLMSSDGVVLHSSLFDVEWYPRALAKHLDDLGGAENIAEKRIADRSALTMSQSAMMAQGFMRQVREFADLESVFCADDYINPVIMYPYHAKPVLGYALGWLLDFLGSQKFQELHFVAKRPAASQTWRMLSEGYSINSLVLLLGDPTLIQIAVYRREGATVIPLGTLFPTLSQEELEHLALRVFLEVRGSPASLKLSCKDPGNFKERFKRILEKNFNLECV